MTSPDPAASSRTGADEAAAAIGSSTEAQAEAGARPGAGLAVRGLTVRRGGRRVLQDVDLDVPEGQVTALLGSNGAGKSSLVLALAGLLPAEAGTVRLGKQELLGERPEAVRAAGLAAVPEGHRVLTKLTVEENIRVAAAASGRHRRAGGGRGRGRGDIERAWAVFPELVPLRDRAAGTLSGGEQQMLALAQAIVRRPRVILADEMSLGLAPRIVRRLVEVVAELAAEGIGVLLIEQFTNVALGLAGRVLVLERGRIRFDGTA